MGDNSGAAVRGVPGRDADLNVGPENALGVLIVPGNEPRGLVGLGGAYEVQGAVTSEGYGLGIPVSGI